MHEVLPKTKRERDIALSVVVLQVLRATSLPWAAGLNPDHLVELRAAAAKTTKAMAGSTSTATFAPVAEAFAGAKAVAATRTRTIVSVLAQGGASAVDNSLAIDVEWIDDGRFPAHLASAPLWLSGTPPSAIDAWRTLKAAMLDSHEDWQVWTDWYESRLDGSAANEALEVARALIDDEIWKQGPRVVNAEIARLIELHPPKPVKAPDPALGSALAIANGRLTLTNLTPPGDFSRSVQGALHQRLRALCPNLLAKSKQVGNTHPGLLSIAAEYAELIAEPVESLDVVALWAVGAGVVAAADTFSRPPQTGVMQEPLEPEHLVLLKQVASVHGGFILGFELGRELTDRADNARVGLETLSEIIPPAHDLLDRWSRATKFVEERTRHFFAALSSAAVEPSWRIARSGYSVYAFTRDALIALGRAASALDRSATSRLSVATAVVLVAPQYAAESQAMIEFLLANAPTVLAFSDPFPELKFWLVEVLDALKKDHDFRSR
jgi:hypothetical protein